MSLPEAACKRLLNSAAICMGLVFLLSSGMANLHPSYRAEWVTIFFRTTRVAWELFRPLYVAIFFWVVFREWAKDGSRLRILLLVAAVWVSLSSLPFREWAGAQFLLGWLLLSFASPGWRSRWSLYLTIFLVLAFIAAFGPFSKPVSDFLMPWDEWLGKGLLTEHFFLSLCFVPIFYYFVCDSQRTGLPAGFGRRLAVWTFLGILVDSSLTVLSGVIETSGRLPRAQDIACLISLFPDPFYAHLLLSAFIEELLFRGLLFSLLEDIRRGAGWLLSPIAFCIIHPFDPWWYYPFHFASAILLTYLRVRSHSLIPGIIVHAFGNVVSLLRAPELFSVCE